MVALEVWLSSVLAVSLALIIFLVALRSRLVPPPLVLAGKGVLITGGSAGIGKAIAKVRLTLQQEALGMILSEGSYHA